ncbi:MAG: SlyX family protein [Verrucomicrobia bacterium]|nr:SlyX family protein [Verrucomicrobiota bacterium]
MDTELAQRLERLESHVANLQRQFEELNQVIIEQAKSLRKLQANQQRLADTVETTELDRIKSTNAKPPHYQ